MIYARKQLPKYCRHKSSGRAFVRIGGKMYYLGKHGSQASRREYDRIIAEFVANGRQAFYAPDEIPIESLIIQYLDYANRELNYSEGRKCRLRRLMDRLNKLYGKQPVSAFGASALKAIRQGYIDEGIARDTIND
jgi:replicative superfamily II helicase